VSRFLDLLKQIPPGKEEIPEVLLKQLDMAAYGLINSEAGQHDLSEVERAEYDEFHSKLGPEEPNSIRKGRWGLLDKWPLMLGDLAIFRSKDSEYWYLGISSGDNPCLMLKCGSKDEILEEEERLNEYRKTEGEESLEDEVMRLVDKFRDKANKNRGWE